MKSHWKVGMGLALLAGTAWAEAPKAATKIEWNDPAGDIYPGNGEENARDVVKLNLASDGTAILVTATLAKDEESTVAGDAVLLYFDTDDKAATGAKTDFDQPGFEFTGRLSVCLSYDGAQIAACAGGVPDQAPKTRHARAVVEKFTGKAGDSMRPYDNLATVLDGFGPATTPLKGRVLEIKIPYSTLGVKPGQKVRILVREGDQFSAEGFFPETRLTLQ